MRADLRVRAGAALLWLAACATAAAIELGPAELAGRRLFREGIGANGHPVMARAGLADATVPGHVVPCANCHGSDGLGRAESGVQPPVILWSELTKPYGHRHDNGRAHPAFDRAGVLRAVTQGIDPAGQPIDRAMPRYALSRDDQDNLIAYLQRLEFDVDPGVHRDRLRIGTLLPLSGPLADSGRLAQRVLEAVFEDLNAAGGVYGRRLELVSEDGAARGPGGTRWPALEERADLLALVAPYVPGEETDLLAQVEARRLPLVGPLGARAADAAAGAARYGFFLQPGLRELVRALAVHAAGRDAVVAAPLLLVAPADAAHDVLVEAVQQQCERSRCGAVETHRFAAGRFDAIEALAALRRGAADTVLFLAGDAELAAWLQAADAAGLHPAVLWPGTLGLNAALRAPPSFAGRIVLAFPASPDEALRAGGRFEAFRARHRLPSAGVTVQLAAYSSAMLLVEGVRRSGRAVGREKLVAALETLRDFRSDAAPPLSFGPDRRIGAPGGHLVALEAGARFRTVSPWLSLD